MTPSTALLVVFCLLSPFAVAQQPNEHHTQRLPNGVLKAMAGDERDYCHQWLGEYRKSCGEKFRHNLLWRELVITPSGERAILVENPNLGACGSAGCALSLFAQRGKHHYDQLLGELGKLTAIAVLNTITNGYYDLQKTWADGTTNSKYRWDGRRYSPDPQPQ
jgi:hypothetical protein